MIILYFLYNFFSDKKLYILLFFLGLASCAAQKQVIKEKFVGKKDLLPSTINPSLPSYQKDIRQNTQDVNNDKQLDLQQQIDIIREQAEKALIEEDKLNQKTENMAVKQQQHEHDLHQDIYPDSLNIAVLLPLTGNFAQTGQDLADAAQLALFRLNSENIRLQFYDTKADTKQAYRMAEKAIKNGADVILGPLLAETTAAVKSYIRGIDRQPKINIFSFSNTITLADENLFLLGLNPGEQIEKLLDHLLRLGENRVAALLPDDDYGYFLHQSLIDYSRTRQMPVPKIIFFPTDANDYTPYIQQISLYESRKFALQEHRRKLRQENTQNAIDELDKLDSKNTFGPLPYDMLFIGTRDENKTRVLSAQIDAFDANNDDVILAGLAEWLNLSSLSNEPSLDRAIVAALPKDSQEKFNALFQENYQRKPQDIAPLSFDAIALYTILTRLHGRVPNHDDIINPLGFRGINGVFILLDNGIVKRNYDLYEVDNSKFFPLGY